MMWNEMVMNGLEYSEWLVALKSRYRAAQIKAAVAVNGALIEFYWSLGRDIEEQFKENQYGTAFFERLSNDLCVEIPNVKGLSPINLRYANRFYRLYRNLPQLVEELKKVPWSSHRLIIDRSGGNTDKATFYVRRTIENAWSRHQLGLQLNGNLYEKIGAASSNIEGLLPAPVCHQSLMQRFLSQMTHVAKHHRHVWLAAIWVWGRKWYNV